jgi:RNA polymerase sigma factor (sigma-70 family)
VATDTFIKLFEYIKKQPVENIKSLIYRIAHNTAIDHIRSKQSENINDFQDEKVEIIHDHHDIQKKENINSKYKQEIIQQFLSKLDTQSRDILYLYYQEEKSYDEIAIIHESNKNTV